MVLIIAYHHICYLILRRFYIAKREYRLTGVAWDVLVRPNTPICVLYTYVRVRVRVCVYKKVLKKIPILIKTALFSAE